MGLERLPSGGAGLRINPRPVIGQLCTRNTTRFFEHYNGSYARDVESWSDQNIDDVFDGDPEAYWNID